jgi:hypothetical protein
MGLPIEMPTTLSDTLWQREARKKTIGTVDHRNGSVSRSGLVSPTAGLGNRHDERPPGRTHSPFEGKPHD